MGPDIRPLFPEARLAGYALTVHAVPAYALPDEPYKMELAAVDALQPGDVMVVSTIDGSFWGELLTTAARCRGARGIVVDGYTRDCQAIMGLGFPTFVRGIHMAELAGAAGSPRLQRARPLRRRRREPRRPGAGGLRRRRGPPRRLRRGSDRPRRRESPRRRTWSASTSRQGHASHRGVPSLRRDVMSEPLRALRRIPHPRQWGAAGGPAGVHAGNCAGRSAPGLHLRAGAALPGRSREEAGGGAGAGRRQAST